MPRISQSRIVHFALLMAVTAALVLPGLGSISLWDIDEGLNAEAAREMLESGDWVVPTFNFKPRTAKPALLYWLQALAYQQFGVNEFAARLPSALCGAIAILLTYELGRRMFSAATGLLAGLIAASSIQVSILMHAATPDAPLLACTMLAFWLFWIGAENGGRHWTWTTGLGCGLAVLAKGPIGIVMPAAVIGYYFLARRQVYRLLDRRLLLGLGLVLLIAGPWYALVGAETRGRFLRAFWQSENVGRFLAPMEGHRGSIFYYPLAMLLGLTPWNVVLLPGLWDAMRSLSPSRRKNCPAPFEPAAQARDSDATMASPSLACAAGSHRGFMGKTVEIQSSAVCFLICWAAVFVGFFSLAQTKLPNYILPAYPPMALLTARYLLRWRAGIAAVPRWLMAVSIAALAIVGIGTAAGLAVAGGVLTPSAYAGKVVGGLARSAWLGIVPIIGALAATWCLRHGRRPAFVATLVATAVTFIGLAAIVPLPAIEARKACRPLVLGGGACRPADEIRIACLAYFQPSLVFYARREVSELYTPEQALDLLRGPLPAYVFCPADLGTVLASHGSYRVTARQRDLYRGIDVVVVTNQLQ